MGTSRLGSPPYRNNSQLPLQGVFPHGIDTLRTIDFLTVSVRKRAFLEAAPAVAQLVLSSSPFPNVLLANY